VEKGCQSVNTRPLGSSRDEAYYMYAELM